MANENMKGFEFTCKFCNEKHSHVLLEEAGVLRTESDTITEDTTKLGYGLGEFVNIGDIVDRFLCPNCLEVLAFTEDEMIKLIKKQE